MDNNREFNQTTHETVNTSEHTASDTLETLNKLNAANSNPNLTASNVLAIIGGILFFITAICHIVYSIQNLIYFFQCIGSGYVSFGSIFSHIIMFMGYLAAAAGFGLTGGSLIIRNYNQGIQLMKIASLLIIAYCACSVLSNLIYLCNWVIFGYVFWILFYIVYGLLWVAIAMLVFRIRPDLTKRMSLAYIIVPSVMLVLHILFNVSTFYYGFGNVLLTIIEFAALIITGVVIYMNLNSPENCTVSGTDTSNTAGTASENHTAGSESYYSVAPDPEGYTGIVKLILLSIVTFGIYTYIWIYRTAVFIGKRTPLALQSSPGVQVVLCLFVPFYIIYWVYKQSKAIDDYKTRNTGIGGDDLSLICLLLCIFGFSIIAYALMQEQINKVVKPSPSPAYDYYPSPSADTVNSTINNSADTPETSSGAQSTASNADTVSTTEAQIETLKKLKSLLDAGILTQEEFDAKKKEVLSL